MIPAQYQWQIKNVDQPSAEAQELAAAEKISPIVAQILWNRGYQTTETAHAFLNPGPEQLHDPFALHDMQRGIDRIEDAIGADQQITIYGDYDADGVTSTSILYETLNEMGAKVNYYIPNRFKDGYGPNVDAFKRLIAAGTELFVTVDNGVAGNDAIAAAKAAGVDVVVTDHHELPETLPEAYAIIHPRYPGAEYPFGGLSGAGVAFKVAQALREEIPQDLLDLAAIGTVADLVPLVDENRVLVHFGLQLLKQDERPGLQALMKTAGLKPDELTEQSIGFGLAPRLNALGRLEDAAPAVEFLTTLDETQASQLAQQTESQNHKRQELVRQISSEALAQATDEAHQNRPTLIISGHGWHEGVLGIVASKVVETTGKPALVLNVADDGHAKGSGRSVAAFNLFTALDGHRDLMTAFGGHHMAVGLTVPADKLEALADALDVEAQNQKLTESGPSEVAVAASLDVATVTPDLYRELAQLAPFGTDNQQPLFAFESATLTQIKAIGKDHTHLKFQLQEGQHQLNAIQFGAGNEVAALTAAPDQADVLGAIEDNVWQGRHSLQLMVKDLRLAEKPGDDEQVGINTQADGNEQPVIDERTTRLHQAMFKDAGVYLFFHRGIYDQLLSQLPKDSTAVLYDGSVQSTLPPESRVFVVDCPDATADLETVLGQLKPATVTAYLYKKESLSQLGMPTRPQYAKLFKFIAMHQQVDVGHQLSQLVSFLEIPRTQLVFMIQVFFECGFITIDHGIMNGVPQPESKDLSTAPSYQLRLQQIQTEKDLLACSTAALTTRLHAPLI
ncbi:single-stranded-DNA-specific exonuclease RecJ [Levilactobacillus paucivorans]|uniref:single-stranded-DNA-specific exonuclease RecJ n=1 Tax=Levilactobacillus paucivorans TaxID=616990 RepID=UPI00070EEACF|nr:single-stranded-DNA-specific exonuclease RecJ [Levilactobacillus paucivorans]